MTEAKFVSGKDVKVNPVEFGVVESFRFVTSPLLLPPPQPLPVGNWRPSKHAGGKKK